MRVLHRTPLPSCASSLLALPAQATLVSCARFLNHNYIATYSSHVWDHCCVHQTFMRAAAALVAANAVLALLSPATCFVVPTATHTASSSIGQRSGACDGGRSPHAGRAEQQQRGHFERVLVVSGAEWAGRERGLVLSAVTQVCTFRWVLRVWGESLNIKNMITCVSIVGTVFLYEYEYCIYCCTPDAAERCVPVMTFPAPF